MRDALRLGTLAHGDVVGRLGLEHRDDRALEPTRLEPHLGSGSGTGKGKGKG